MAAEPEREPDRNLAGKQLEPQAKIDAGSSVGRCVLLIYDQHEWIWAYGDLPAYTRVLQGRGFTEGEVVLPVPHSHSYNAAFDTGGAADMLEHGDDTLISPSSNAARRKQRRRSPLRQPPG